jgi:hypothetical protein
MVIVAGWVLAAVLAVLVGVVGIGLVGAGMTSRRGAPVTEDDVLRALGSSSAPASSPPAPSSAPSSSPASASQAFPTRGGTVVASCDRILTMAPAQGFAIHEQRAQEGEFRGVRDNHDRVKFELTCANGVPDLRIRDVG